MELSFKENCLFVSRIGEVSEGVRSCKENVRKNVRYLFSWEL